MTKSTIDSASVLRSCGLKATPQRVRLLELLSQEGMPIGIPELIARKDAKGMDTVTLYRSLETLADAKLVRRVDLRHGHSDYELINDGMHHHHLVCENCGTIEDIDWCPDSTFEKQLMKKSKHFAKLTDHSLEFFGLCKKCSRSIKNT